MRSQQDKIIDEELRRERELLDLQWERTGNMFATAALFSVGILFIGVVFLLYSIWSGDLK